MYNNINSLYIPFFSLFKDTHAYNSNQVAPRSLYHLGTTPPFHLLSPNLLGLGNALALTNLNLLSSITNFSGLESPLLAFRGFIVCQCRNFLKFVPAFCLKSKSLKLEEETLDVELEDLYSDPVVCVGGGGGGAVLVLGVGVQNLMAKAVGRWSLLGMSVDTEDALF